MSQIEEAIQFIQATRDWFSDPSTWTKAAFGRDEDGNHVPLWGGDTKPVKCCLYGALFNHRHASTDAGFLLGIEKVNKAIGGVGISRWNDAPERTFEDVVGLLDDIINDMKEER